MYIIRYVGLSHRWARTGLEYDSRSTVVCSIMYPPSMKSKQTIQRTHTRQRQAKKTKKNVYVCHKITDPEVTNTLTVLIVLQNSGSTQAHSITKNDETKQKNVSTLCLHHHNNLALFYELIIKVVTLLSIRTTTVVPVVYRGVAMQHPLIHADTQQTIKKKLSQNYHLFVMNWMNPFLGGAC